MLYNYNIYSNTDMSDWFEVALNGLPLDLSVAGYLNIIPAVLLTVSVWKSSKSIATIAHVYFVVTSFLVSLAFLANLILYEYWGFPLDLTPVFYLFGAPASSLASVSAWFIIIAMLAYTALSVITYIFFRILCLKSFLISCERKRTALSFYLVLLTASLFLPIRGGITVSTMNTGKVFFSNNFRLNHAAVNPLFSFLESALHDDNIEEKYRYMDDAEAKRTVLAMLDNTVKNTSSESMPTDTLFTVSRPNIILVIMESFSSKLMRNLGGEENVAVNLEQLSEEGILFTDFYANSFRTDRGVVSILSGFPAQPTMSIMKYPNITAQMPSIGKSLLKAGYRTKYYYGGDADFTNMRSYLFSSGFTEIVSDEDFPINERISKWGVHDHLVFNKLEEDLKTEKDRKPFFKVILTSSSHEPFEVPYKKLNNKRLNAFAYTDSCIGKFVRQIRVMPQWKNTVVIMVPDHLGAYPENISNFSIDRYRIPLIIIGGAVRKKMKIDVIGSQQDIAATLLSQLNIKHNEFIFSKDLLNPANNHFAFFTVPDAFGLVTQDNKLIFDNKSGKIMLNEGKAKGKNLHKGKAYLQYLYDVISEMKNRN